MDLERTAPFERSDGGYLISTDRSRLDLVLIHDFLAHSSYWALDIPLERVRKSIQNSLCFGVYQGERQVGFGRVVSDFATFAYLADVFILPEHRGKGLAQVMMEGIMTHPNLQGLRLWVLLTRDAHALYARFGFRPPAKPERYMEIRSSPPPQGR